MPDKRKPWGVEFDEAGKPMWPRPGGRSRWLLYIAPCVILAAWISVGFALAPFVVRSPLVRLVGGGLSFIVGLFAIVVSGIWWFITGSASAWRYVASFLPWGTPVTRALLALGVPVFIVLIAMVRALNQYVSTGSGRGVSEGDGSERTKGNNGGGDGNGKSFENPDGGVRQRWREWSVLQYGNRTVELGPLASRASWGMLFGMAASAPICGIAALIAGPSRDGQAIVCTVVFCVLVGALVGALWGSD